MVLAYGSFAGTLVQFNFYRGTTTNASQEVDVELYDNDKPITVHNFLSLIEVGAFGNGLFHRCVPGFVLQGGGYLVGNPFATSVIAPPYTNVGSVGNFGPITNEFGVGKFYSNIYGTMAMAKTSDPNSATSQFFFNLADNSATLDSTNNSGGFTVFGHVVRGTNILNYFNTLSLNHGIVNLTNNYGVANGGLFTQLPTIENGTNAPPYNELIYFTMTILTAQVHIVPTNGARQISWPSVNGATNLVEYSTNFPPVWKVLVSTNGNGNTFTVTDTTTNKTGRWYRLNIEF